MENDTSGPICCTMLKCGTCTKHKSEEDGHACLSLSSNLSHDTGDETLLSDPSTKYLDEKLAIMKSILAHRGPSPEIKSRHRADLAEWLLLGDLDDAVEVMDGGVASHGVVGVVNAFMGVTTEHVARPQYDALGIAYLGVDAEDEPMYPLLHRHLAEVHAFATSLPPGRVLIHCKEGKNRSAALCVALLMAEKKWTLPSALLYVVERRPIVLTNEGFLKQLTVYAEENQLL